MPNAHQRAAQAGLPDLPFFFETEALNSGPTPPALLGQIVGARRALRTIGTNISAQRLCLTAVPRWAAVLEIETFRTVNSCTPAELRSHGFGSTRLNASELSTSILMRLPLLQSTAFLQGLLFGLGKVRSEIPKGLCSPQASRLLGNAFACTVEKQRPLVEAYVKKIGGGSPASPT